MAKVISLSDLYYLNEKQLLVEACQCVFVSLVCTIVFVWNSCFSHLNSNMALNEAYQMLNTLVCALLQKVL